MMVKTGKLGHLGASDITVAIAQAIYRMEGSGPNTLATRNNNPGNLRSGQGQLYTNGGYAVFATMEDGWNALYHQIDLNIAKGLNLYEFFGGKPGVYAGYAPSADSNNPVHYADFVSQQTGIDPNVPLNQLSGNGSLTDFTGLTDTTGDGSTGSIDPNMLLIMAIAGAGLLALAVTR